MYCMNCGKRLPDDAKSCDRCGMPVGEYKPEENSEENPYVSGYSYGTDYEEMPRTDGSGTSGGRSYDSSYEEKNSSYGYSSFTKPDQDSYGYYEDRPPLRSGGLAIASLVLCILGAVSCCAPFFSIPMCIAGIVCGALGLKSDKRTMAMVSMIISIVFLVISIALLIYSIALIPYMDDYWAEYGYVWK